MAKGRPKGSTKTLPTDVRATVRLPQHIHQHAREVAAACGMTLSNWLCAITTIACFSPQPWVCGSKIIPPAATPVVTVGTSKSAGPSRWRPMLWIAKEQMK